MNSTLRDELGLDTGKRNPWPKRLMLVCAGVAMLAVGYRFIGQTPVLSQARFATVIKGDIDVLVDCNAVVIYQNMATLVTASGGIVKDLHVSSGQKVAKHDLLVELSNTEIDEQLQKAVDNRKDAATNARLLKSELVIRRFELENALAKSQEDMLISAKEQHSAALLQKNGVISKIQFERTNASLASAVRLQKESTLRLQQFDGFLNERRASIDLVAGRAMADEQAIRRQLTLLHVRAPADGVIAWQNDQLQPGSNINANTELFKFATNDQLSIELEVPSSYGGDLKVGQKVTLINHPQGGVGKIVSKNATIELDHIRAAANFTPMLTGLTPGANIGATLTVNTLIQVTHVELPKTARPNSRAFIFVLVGRTGFASRRSVLFGRSAGKYAEVLEGLTVGERVVLNDTTKFSSEDRISVDN